METHAAAPLFSVLSKISSLSLDDERKEALRVYAELDDGWWFQQLRGLQSSADEPLLSACLNLALDRARSLKSLWKRKGDLSAEQFGALRQIIKDWTSPTTETVPLQEIRRNLMGNGVLFIFFGFRPYDEVRDKGDGDSVMLVQSKDRKVRPVTQLSPLIRYLKEVWEEDIHLYAFADQRNAITIDELLGLMALGAKPNTKS
jgi:hypothetical protein